MLNQPSPNPPQIFQGSFSTVLIKVRSYNKVGKLELLWDSLSTHWMGAVMWFSLDERETQSPLDMRLIWYPLDESLTCSMEQGYFSTYWGRNSFGDDWIWTQIGTLWNTGIFLRSVHLRAIKTRLDSVPLYLLSVLYVLLEGSDHRSLPCSVAILTFLLNNNNNLCPMSHLWHDFVRTESHSQRHYRPHCTLSCPKPRKILEKSSKLLWWVRMLVIA